MVFIHLTSEIFGKAIRDTVISWKLLVVESERKLNRNPYPKYSRKFMNTRRDLLFYILKIFVCYNSTLQPCYFILATCKLERLKIDNVSTCCLTSYWNNIFYALFLENTLYYKRLSIIWMQIFGLYNHGCIGG